MAVLVVGFRHRLEEQLRAVTQSSIDGFRSFPDDLQCGSFRVSEIEKPVTIGKVEQTHAHPLNAPSNVTVKKISAYFRSDRLFGAVLHTPPFEQVSSPDR